MNLIRSVIVIFILLATFADVFAVDKNGSNVVVVHDVYADPGEAITADVEIVNDDVFIAFQVDFVLPEGFSYIDGSAVLSDRAQGHNLTATMVEDDKLRLLSYSMSNAPFLGNSGIVVSFGLQTPEEEDIWQLSPENVVIGSESHTNLHTGSYNGAIVLGSPKAILDINSDPEDDNFILEGAGEYEIGEQVQISAEGYGEYEFDVWSGQDEDIALLDDKNDPQTFFDMPVRHVTLTADFKLKEYLLEVYVEPSGTGSVSIRPEKDYFHKGEQITLKANSAEGYEFCHWSREGEELGNDSILVYNMPGEDVIIEANFSPIDYTITVEVSPDFVGTVVVVPEKEYYHIGDVVKLEANAYEGQGGKFICWTDAEFSVLSQHSQVFIIMEARDKYKRANFSRVAEILSFTVDEMQVEEEIIDSREATIHVTVDFDSDLTSVDPAIVISDDATIMPDGAVDFSGGPVIYTVIPDDENISPKEWSVTVEEADPTANEILDFDFYYDDVSAGVTENVYIDSEEATVDVYVFFSTDIENLTPYFTLSYGASIHPVPAAGDFMVFGADYEYTITSADGEHIKSWDVTIHELPNTEAKILDFVLEEQTGPALINPEISRVDIEVVHGSDVTALTPSITISENATIIPDGGVELDFSDPVIYTVHSQDGATSRNWMVDVSVQPLQLYDLNLTVIPPEGGGVYGGGVYEEGEQIPVSAIPSSGYRFIKWTYEDNSVASNEPQFTFTMPGEDVTLVANFEEKRYDVRFEVYDNETGNFITDAQITLGNITNEVNDYIFKDILPGTYNYKVLADSYFKVTGSTAVDDDDIIVTVQMEGFGPNIVSIPDVVSKPGERITVFVDVVNADEFVAFQMDIDIPEGFKKVSGSAILSDRAGDHELLTQMIDSTLTLFSWSFSNMAYTGNSGAIASFELETVDEEGRWGLKAENATLGSASSNNICTGSFGGVIELTFESFVQGYNDQEIIIYPNPVKDKLNIESERIIISRLSIYDIGGQVLIDKHVDGYRAAVDVGDLKPSIYIIRVYSDEAVITRRVQVVR